jgi:hypothetical protein
MSRRRELRLHRLTLRVPEMTYFRIKQLAMVNHKPVSALVLAGIKHVLRNTPEWRDWPAEYFENWPKPESTGRK